MAKKRKTSKKKKTITYSESISRQDWYERAERIAFLSAEIGRRKVNLEPMSYGAPDIMFPRDYHPGVFDASTGNVIRVPLGVPETEEEYAERQNQAIYDLVTGYLTVAKDDKIVKIRLIPKMAEILGDLFYERVDKLILWANRGGGKCLGENESVIMADGRVAKVKAIHVGDRLMGPDGKARTVLSTTHGRGPLYRITPIKGEPWVCNDKHVLTLISGHNDAVIDIPVEDFLGKYRSFREAHKQFSVGVDEFEPSNYAPLENDPYDLGLSFGRGRANSGVKFADAVLRGARNTRLAFLAGFLDTDAELHHNGYVIAQKSEDCARAIWWIARSLGFMSIIKEVTKSCQNNFTGTYHQVSIYGNVDEIPLRIPHKKANPRKQRKCATRTGITVEPIGEGDYYGFMLDGDGRFLLGDFTVTHNSLLAAVFMWISFVYKRKSCLNMGGCLLPGSWVWTNNGLKTTEDMGPDDRIWGLDGKLKSINGRWTKNWMTGAVCVKTPAWPAGNHFTPDHKILAIRGLFGGDAPPDISSHQWIPAGELEPQDAAVIPRPPGSDVFPCPKEGGTKDGLSAECAGLAYRDALRDGLCPVVTNDDGRWSIEAVNPECLPDKVKVTPSHAYYRIDSVEHYYYQGPVYDLTVPEGQSFGMLGMHVHNSGNQARRVYDYTKQFWHCVLPGVPIITSWGLVPIEKISAAYRVLSEDGTFRPVVYPKSSLKDCTAIHIDFRGGLDNGFNVTEDHRILTDKGWVPAKELKFGDILLFPRIRTVPPALMPDLALMQSKPDGDVEKQLLSAVRKAFLNVRGKNQLVCLTRSPNFAAFIWCALNRMGIWASLQGPPKKSELHKITVEGSAASRLLALDNEHTPPPKDDEPKVDEDYFYIPCIKTKSFHYKGPVYDIGVEGKHSFCTVGATLHNCFPGMLTGMLSREPLLQSSEMKNGSKLICATSVSTAIGEHIGLFTADEASIVKTTQILCSQGLKQIQAVNPGDKVISKDGVYQEVIEQFSHPYKGRILWLKPYGCSLPCWVTEEHRMWAIPNVTWVKKGKDRKRKCPVPRDIAGRSPEWVRAWDLKKNDILCYPRAKRRGVRFELKVGDRTFSGPDLWRFFGYWAGDGGAPAGTRGAYPVKLHLSQAKTYFMDDAENLLGRFSTGSIHRSAPPSRGKAIDIVASSDKLLFGILRYTVRLGKHRGYPRAWLEAATNEELRNYLTGHIRTDGSKAFRKDGKVSGWQVTTTAEGLALNALYALNRLGVVHSVVCRKSARYGVESLDRWDIRISVQGAREILPESDLEGLVFPREAPAKTWYDDDWCYSVIREVAEDHYDGPVYDLKMDGDPSFGTAAATMLHNCTDRPGADMDLMRAMQGAMSENPHTIFLLSTFHLPVGFFADCWDNADSLGFTQVRWSCFDTMQKCEAGLEYATPEDPKAIESFCKAECPLTWEVDVLDEFGSVVGKEHVGCGGQARDSEGWQTRAQVLDEQKINQGTRIFSVEHACLRPVREGNIYNKALIDGCAVPYFNLCMDRRKIVGIDWGLTQCAMVLIGEWIEMGDDPTKVAREGIGVIDVVYMSNRLVDTVVEQIRTWQIRYGDNIMIRADGSHPYCNRELATHGYRVVPVYGDRKLLGEDNLARWLGSGLFSVLDGFELFMTQMHNLRRNVTTGKQVKRNLEGEEGDHGPDALKFAMMEYDYVKWTNRKQQEQKKLDEGAKRNVPQGKLKPRGFDGLLF